MRTMDPRRMCPNCRAFITTKDRVCPYCNEKVGPRAIDRREPAQVLGGLIPHAHFYTVMIMLVNFGLFAATVIFSMNAGNSDALMNIDGRTLFDFGAKFPPAIFLGQWWRLVTAGFLHGGLFHILMNSWVLFDVGAEVEELYGPRRLIVIYLISSVFGFLVSTYWSNSLSIGASAGLMGLIGAMIAVGVTHKSAVGAAIRNLYIRWVIYILIFGLLPFFNIDNAAHIGGLIAGFILGYIAGLPKLIDNWVEKFWRLASYACIAVTVWSFVDMFIWFSRNAQ